MSIRTMYRNYFRNNLFIRYMFIFSLITVGCIIAFSYLSILFVSQIAVQQHMDVQKRAMESVSREMENKFEAVQAMLRDVYRDEDLSRNVSYLLENSYEDYVKHSLDSFFNENKSNSDPLQYFMNKTEDNSDISSMVLYSAMQQNMFVFHPLRRFELITTNAGRSFIPDSMLLDDSKISKPNIWVRKAIQLEDTPMYSIRVPISNKDLLRNVGQLLVYVDAKSLQRTLDTYHHELLGSFLVVSPKNEVLFDSSGAWYGKTFLASDVENASSSFGKNFKDIQVTTLTNTKAGFTVINLIPQAELAKTYRGKQELIIILGGISIVIAIIMVSFVIQRFARRTHEIIRFTRKVKNGDLEARIQNVKEDELGQIAKSFNDMIEELNSYIDRVYKADIKQKHTEIAALEARVNPHFLYNTLEVIRMRAISQGAMDVGEMIYSLSALFKSYVRQKPNYTLKDELEACRLYLELFRIRYKDRFSYEIHCAQPLEALGTMKMSLQPIIENYILHGIQSNREDNRIVIMLQEDEHDLIAIVRDNGRGIPEERLEQLRSTIEREEQAGDSFGLRSIHERLRLLYGEPYGIEIQSEVGIGTEVRVRFPNSGKG